MLRPEVTAVLYSDINYTLIRDKDPNAPPDPKLLVTKGMSPTFKDRLREGLITFGHLRYPLSLEAFLEHESKLHKPDPITAESYNPRTRGLIPPWNRRSVIYPETLKYPDPEILAREEENNKYYAARVGNFILDVNLISAFGELLYEGVEIRFLTNLSSAITETMWANLPSLRTIFTGKILGVARPPDMESSPEIKGANFFFREKDDIEKKTPGFLAEDDPEIVKEIESVAEEIGEPDMCRGYYFPRTKEEMERLLPPLQINALNWLLENRRHKLVFRGETPTVKEDLQKMLAL